MTMNVKTYVNEPFSQNTYICTNEFDECLVIDPGGSVQQINSYIEKNKLSLSGIVLTHGHCDHMAGIMGIVNKTPASIYLNENDFSLVDSAAIIWSFTAKSFAYEGPSKDSLTPLPLGNIKLSHFSFECIHTPGHSPGSCLLDFGDKIFVGDTIFKNSVGRTDLIGGDDKVLASTLMNFPSFSENSVFFPGHGEPFTIENLNGVIGAQK